MLNNQNERELCYAVRVTDITPIEGADEGLVFRSLDGKLSFKAVSNKFLEKYHG